MANKNLIIQSDLDLREKVMKLLQCITQEQTARLICSIKHMNLSLAQFNILHLLAHDASKKLTVKQIKNGMLDESPNVSRSLNKLMENGYIIKERNKVDQRVVNVYITDKGLEIHEEAHKKLMNISLNLSKEEYEKLNELLLKI